MRTMMKRREMVKRITILLMTKVEVVGMLVLMVRTQREATTVVLTMREAKQGMMM